jgi:hypothetical protein
MEVIQVAKAAVLVLADTETHEDLGRAVNALVAAREFKDSGDEVRVIFDGAGTKWVKELARPDHRAHPLYEAWWTGSRGRAPIAPTRSGSRRA